MSKKLIIVDVQKDFYDKESGSLYVPDGEEIVDTICQKIINDDDISEVILTIDWHRMNDNSFSCNGGPWPIHCLRHSDGASVHRKILDAIQRKGVEYSFFLKGDNPTKEEYGAFEVQIRVSNGITAAFNQLKTSRNIFRENEQCEICGLAGDYCVWETYKNLKKMNLEVAPLYDCIKWIGEPFDYEKKLKEEEN